LGIDSDCEGLLLSTNACPKDVWMAPKPKRVTKHVIKKKLKFLLDNEKIELKRKLRINLSLGNSY
jgi:hypothetical protein